MPDDMGWGMARAVFGGIGCLILFFVLFLIAIAFMIGTHYQ